MVWREELVEWVGYLFSHGCGMIGGFWCGKGGEDDWLVRCIARQFV